MIKTISLVTMLVISGLFAAHAHALTFAEWDQMTKEQQDNFIAETVITIYQWMKENKPAVPTCMDEKFGLLDDSNEPTPALIEMNKKIAGVPEKERAKYRVEALMVNYIVEICPES